MTAGPLLLVGAGGLAREVLAAVGASGSAAPGRTVLGYLDDNPALHGRHIQGLPVLGPLDAVAEHPDADVVVCVASPKDPSRRRRVVERLALPVERYATVVHPAASLAPGTQLGAGSVFLACTVVTAAQQVGAHVVAMPHTTITHDDEVGDYVMFGTGVGLSGSVSVGPCAYLGSGALVREGLSIGAGSIVGIGAVVLADVPPFEVWVGNPARRLRTLDRSDDQTARAAR